MSKFYVYMVRTRSDRLYTGIAVNPEARVKQHNDKRGSKALKGQLPVELVWVSRQAFNRSTAQIHEAAIKKWRRKQKELLIHKEDDHGALVQK